MKIFAYLLLFTSFCKATPKVREVPTVYLLTCFSGPEKVYQNFGINVRVRVEAWRWNTPTGDAITTTVPCTAIRIPTEKVPQEVIEAILDSNP